MSRFKDRSRRLAREAYWEKHDRDEYQCPDCGRIEDEITGTFEVHHKNSQPLDNRPENHIALCRVCHCLREGKKPGIEHIRDIRDSVEEHVEERQSESAVQIESVYLAGKMSYYNEDDSLWRSSVSGESRGLGPSWRSAIGNSGPVRINSPEEIHFDHGADLVGGVAGVDLKLLNQSDAILAYFDKKEQVGTLTELLHAVSEGKPALALFDKKYVGPPAIDPFDEFDEDKLNHQWVSNPISMRFESPVYWFLVNYLQGDGSGFVNGSSWDGVNADVTIGVVRNKDGIREAYLEWIKPVTRRTFEKHSNRGAGE